MRGRLTVTVGIWLALSGVAGAQLRIPNNTDPAIASPNQAVGMASDIDAILRGVRGDGVLYGCGVTAQGSPDMTVAVAAGTIRLAGVVISCPSTNATISAANGTNPRIDLVTLSSAGSVVVTAGTAAASPGAPEIPASSVLLAAVYVPAAATSITSARITDKRPMPSGTAAYEVSVTDLGAKCDGSTDDAVALQAAIDAVRQNGGGTIVLPVGTCQFATTLIVGDTSGAQATTFISIRGAGAANSYLRWAGATNTTALWLKRNKYFRFQDFSLNNGVAVGTTIGILEGGFGGIGTETLGGVFDHLGVGGFAIGIQAGDSGVASASDILYTYLELDNNTIGWTNVQLDTLNHVFVDLNLGGNGTGLDCVVGNVVIYGGSTNNNTVTDIRAACNSLLVSGMRPEVKQRFVLGAGGGTYTLTDNLMMPGGSPDNIYVDLGDGQWVIEHNVLTSGYIALARDTVRPQSLRIVGNRMPSTDPTVPMEITAPRVACCPFMVPYVFQSNVRTNTNDPFPDTTGDLYRGWGLPSAVYPAITTTTGNQTATGTTLATLTLDGLRMIGPSSRVAGRNMRLQVVFAGAAALAVTFKHAMTGDTSGGDHFNITAGQVVASDLGRLVCHTPTGWVPICSDVTLADVANNRLYMIGGPQACGACNGIPVVVGEDEPDANYLLAVTCDADERVHWSSKTTTGFTLTSSNATSTAHCDVLVMR